MNIDRYRTLNGPGKGLYSEKGSRFIGYAFPIADEAAFHLEAARIAEQHRGARHLCHARVLGADGVVKRAFDDGEPQGTAGRPILRRLEAAGITFSAVIVVRYFGGTLLGRGGLLRAYGEAAKLAIAGAPVMEVLVRTGLTAHCGYAVLDALRNAVLAAEGELTGSEHAEHCTLRFVLPPSRQADFMERWRSRGVEFGDQAPPK